MTKKTLFLLLTLLIIAVAYSYFGIPKKFETEGGSCYQGVMVIIIYFFLTICSVLNLVSLLAIHYQSKIKTAKILSILSFIIWFIGFVIHSQDSLLIGVTYFTPMLLFNLIFIILIYRNVKQIN